MKYRRLSLEELESMESSFIRFLALQGISGDEWTRLKSEDQARVNELVDQFSDMVIEQTLQQVTYLELKTPQDLRCFHCQADTIIMKGLLVEGNTAVDFTRNQPPEEMMAQIRAAKANIKLYSGEKAYTQNRELELFALIESGAKIDPKGELFLLLDGL